MRVDKFDKAAVSLFTSKPEPIKLGNTNKSGVCGMCGVKVKKLYPYKVGQIKFMVCENCKSIMEL
jgi:hypothetical protein